MPYPTPFHPRTSELCASYRWRDWAGYLAPLSYDTNPRPEYMALRLAAGLTDVTPLFKYDVTGPHAARFLSRVMVRDIRRLKPGEAVYTYWCDDEGKVLDEGTVTRLDEEYFRVTAFAPSFYWFDRHRRGFRVKIDDVSRDICTLELQGPKSREILKRLAGAGIGSLRYFRTTKVRIAGVETGVTRTGYTGDLGYELWTENAHALKLWDALMDGGRPYGLMPVGLDAIDMARIEAGRLLIGTDYLSARECPTQASKTTPFELGLARSAVHLDREPFIGQHALNREREEGSRRASVGLEIDWESLGELFDQFELSPHLPAGAWTSPVPVYADGEQIGHAGSGTWSPILRKNLALALVRSEYAVPGKQLQIETTVEAQRHTVTAAVVERPFYKMPGMRD